MTSEKKERVSLPWQILSAGNIACSGDWLWLTLSSYPYLLP